VARPQQAVLGQERDELLERLLTASNDAKMSTWSRLDRREIAVRGR
jgi:hypothetical protein